MFSYVITKDKDNEKSYLVSNCIEDIDQYCKDNDLEIIARPEYCLLYTSPSPRDS